VFGLLAGLAVNFYQGFNPFLHSALGFFVGIALLLIPFGCGWMGAGDVKCFAVIGALLGVEWLPRVFFYSALSAGLIALGYTAVGHFNFLIMKRLWADLKIAVVTMGRVLPDRIGSRGFNSHNSVPWGVAFAAGAVMAYYVDYNGRLAGF
jgi:prepilin peptidase CpaA